MWCVVDGAWLVVLGLAWRIEVQSPWLSSRMLPKVKPDNVVTGECLECLNIRSLRIGDPFRSGNPTQRHETVE